jgi:hypothetical protein
MRRLITVFAVLCAACSGGSSNNGGTPTTPTPPPQANRPPTISSMTITPTFGVSELTPFNYTASASDQDGDTLTYTWDFAGNPRTGSNGSITFVGSGTGEVRLTVSDGKGGSATETRSITVGSMTGNWVFTVPGQGSINLSLTQTGTVVNGTLVVAPGGFGNVAAGTTGRTEPGQGSIDGNGNVRIRIEIGVFLDPTLTGVMDTSGRRITGTVTGSGFSGQAFTMTK